MLSGSNLTLVYLMSCPVCDSRHQGETCEVVMSRKGPVLKVGLVRTGQATATGMVVGVVYVPWMGMGSPDAAPCD